MNIAEISKLPGFYALHLRLGKAQILQVGRLGDIQFAAGDYVYLGSALGPGGLRGRLGRHLRGLAGSLGQPHWHIDTLRAVCTVQGYGYALASAPRLECLWSQALANLPGAAYVPRFGASDCRTCPAHLVVFASDIAADNEILKSRIPNWRDVEG